VSNGEARNYGDEKMNLFVGLGGLLSHVLVIDAKAIIGVEYMR
jgi:hypothetical protein